jgi:AraC-like DNA-binding protein
MTNTLTANDSGQLESYLETHRNDSFSWRHFFELLGKAVPMTEGVLVTTLPRGTLQIAQPAKLAEGLLKAYAQTFQHQDRATWQAIATGRPLRAQEAWEGEFESSAYFKDFLRPHGLVYLAVAPLSAPVLNGYPGAIQIWRSAELGDFSDSEIEEFGSLIRQLDEALNTARTDRIGEACDESTPWAHHPQVRQFIFDEQGHPAMLSPEELAASLDEHLVQQMKEHAQRSLHELNGQTMVSDRLQLPDERGDLWTFRVVTHKDYPALGGGSFVFFCLQPGRCDWSGVRASDFQADRELARLIPALKYMQQEFHHGPTLTDIARQVHLSPFHFHRQFTELLGLTPKHFLLECQIFEAKRQLVAREKNLARIAKDCGFAHQSHFTSRFKQATGLTPTRWRRLALGLAATPPSQTESV